MADAQTTFFTVERQDAPFRPVDERIKDFASVHRMLSNETLRQQASRCLDCGVPFCHMYACPLGNRIPDYSEAVTQDHWKEALDILHSTNNFPEFTGRICPGLCEASCTLAVNFSANTCQNIEMTIVEHGWKEGWILPEIANYRTGKKVAIIGSGPTGLAAAQQLVRQGHEVIVFERSKRIGGLLHYGIPNFKLEKSVLDRRLGQMRQEGILFETDVEVGRDLSARYLLQKFDAILIASGSPSARNIHVPGRTLDGIHYALDFLSQQADLLEGDTFNNEKTIDPKGKHVVIIGGGDTGSDCAGTAIRRGCASVTQIELLPQPPIERQVSNPWPQWPRILRTSSSHQEGVKRLWGIETKEFIGHDGHVKEILCKKISYENGKPVPIDTSEFIIKADLVLLCLGFIPDTSLSLFKDFNLSFNESGYIHINEQYKSSVDKVFAAGDVVIGPSLVVHAIKHGRLCAQSVHSYLSI